MVYVQSNGMYTVKWYMYSQMACIPKFILFLPFLAPASSVLTYATKSSSGLRLIFLKGMYHE